MRRMHRGCAALTAALGLVVVPTAAHATTASQAFTTPGEHVFVVPPAVFSVSVVLVGGNGGAGAATTGGAPATEVATIAVTPGEPLYAEVGGNGGNGDNVDGGFAGYNGGGSGGDSFFNAPSGAGGGGASDVRRLAACPAASPNCPGLAGSLGSRLVVAAGGGGGGGAAELNNTAAGGFGGAADAAGASGSDDLHGDTHGGGGARGQTTKGGAAGSDPAGSSANVTPGTLGAGGNGGTDVGGGGGGGGGGVFGGGGGGAGAGHLASMTPLLIFGAGGGGGGGGASSLPPGPAGVSGLSLLPTETGAEPQISFTWTLPTPTATTQAASGVTSSSATLHGTVNPNATPLSSCQFTISPKPPAGSTISCAQQIASGTIPKPVSAQLFGLAPRTTYTVRLLAADAQGLSTGAPITFRTRPPPPRITKLSVTVKRRHGHRQGSVKLTLSQAVSLVAGFERRRGKHWVALKRTLAGRAKAGTATIGFNPKGLGGGRYRLTVIATNSVGERSSPQRATFSISR